MISTVVAAITTVLTLAGLGYYLLALWSARSFARDLRQPVADFHPPVSILKPVKGLDPAMYGSFASHCRQEYAGEYEILFAVSSPADPAVAAIQRLQAEFPERSIRLVLCPESLGANGKVSNLVQVLPQARYEYLLINDSDIHVSPRYLTSIMAQFATPAHRWSSRRYGDRSVPRTGARNPGLKDGSIGYLDGFHPGSSDGKASRRRHPLRAGLDSRHFAGGTERDRRTCTASGLPGRRL